MIARRMGMLLALGASIFAASRAHAEGSAFQQPRIEASLGLRAAKIADAGFDPFASSDELLQVSVGLGGTLLKADRLSLAAVGFWDYGSHGSTARGEQSSLDVSRLSIGPELRYHLLPTMYVFAHALPAFAYSKASIEDGVAMVTRSARHWSYGVDGAAGAAFSFYELRNAGRVHPRFWVIAEGGYGYLGSTTLKLKPESGQSAPERSAPLDLGTLSLAGPYLRLSAAVSL